MNRDALLEGIKSAISEKMDDLANDIDAAAESVIRFLERQPGLFNLDPKTQIEIEQEVKDHLLNGAGVIRAYFDGNGNKEMTGLAQYRIYFVNGEILPVSKEYQGLTNNQLEYHGLINCLKALCKISPGSTSVGADLVIMGDSKLVVEQVSGRWRVNEKHLVPLCDEATQLLSEMKRLFKSVKLMWVPSAENLADPHK
jgi:ribonuclease HI